MIGAMLINVIVGFVAHISLYKIFQNTFTARTARLISYATGMAVDIPLSWFIIRQHELSSSDRRKGPAISFSRYIYLRSVAALTLGAGVVFGYMLDEKE